MPETLADNLVVKDITVMNNLDPRLQRMIMRRRQGIRKAATSSTGADEVAVIAKVTDHTLWEQLSEVKPGVVLPRPAGGDFDIVTGRIPVSRIEAVRSQPFVRSLKAPQTIRPTLDRTLPEIGANQLPPRSAAAGGKNAIVGVVDFGCDFAHQNFRKQDGTSRVLAIWDQAGAAGPGSPFGFGRLIRQPAINAALKKNDPYRALGYGPDPDTPDDKGSHGTHVMDIAAGNGRGTRMPGVAPASDLIFVEVAASDVPFSGPAAVGKNFGDSVQLLEALDFIFKEAGDRPCAINVSLGTNGGPHDGSTLVEAGIDRLLDQKPNRAVCIAASNSFSDGIHAGGKVPSGGSADVRWRILEGDSTGNEIDIWYSGRDRFAVELLAPDGRSLVRVEPGQSRRLTSAGRTVVFVANRLDDPNNHDNNIGVFLESDLPAGDYTVRLHGVSVTNGVYHAWIERDDLGQSTFAPPNDNSMTLGSISTGKKAIVVGSYDAHKASTPISFFSSAGPTRDGREKPEVSAPGHDVLAAWSRTKTKAIRKSGTSMATPAVTGVVALMLSEAKAAGKALTIDQIRDILKNTARKNPPPAATSWNPQYGAGRVSAAAAIAKILPAVPAPAPVRAAAAKKKRATAAG